LKTLIKKKSEREYDKRTLERRKLVKEKLKSICNPEQDIESILISLEHYCSIVLQYIKTVGDE
jgi:hypothetical protein